MTRTPRRHWDQTFADLSAWLDTHGRMPTSGGSSDDEKRLAQWVSNQRGSARKGLLPVSRSSRLSSLVGDTSSSAGHEQRRRQLAAWVAANGRLPRVTKDPARSEENLLAHQLRRLMKKYRDGAAKLHHIEALLSIPGCLEGQDRSDAEARAKDLRSDVRAALEAAPPVPVDTARWETSFAELQSWVSAHGSVPRRRTDNAHEYKVANWMNIQRTHARNEELSADRETRLRAIPGALETKETRTTAERIADLAAFEAEHGRLPLQAAPDPAEASLGNFLHIIRRKLRSGALSAELAAAAGNIPGVIEGGNKSAADALQEYTDFVTRHGHVPQAEKDKALYAWSLKAAAGRAGGAGAPAIQAEVLRIRATYPTYSAWSALTRFETYVAAHGHLPPESSTCSPRFAKASLHRALGSEATPDPVKDSIRTVLAAPAYRAAGPCRLGEGCRA
jgi:hypothetical protein